MVHTNDIIMIMDYHKIKESPNSQNFLSSIKINEMADLEEINDNDIKTIIITKNQAILSLIQPSTIEKRLKNIYLKINRG